jgi:hypothetical protein
MAITRAQQVKQMLQDGGRIGFRGGDAARSDAASGRNAGRADPDTRGSGPSGTDDRGSNEQNINQRAVQRAARVRDLENYINRPTFGFTDAAKFNIAPLPIKILQGLAGIFPSGETPRPPVQTMGGGGDGSQMQTIPLWAQLGFNSEAEYLASLAAQQETETEDQDERFLAFRANGGRIGFRGGDAARSDAASGRNAGRADPSGGVERPGGGGGGGNNNQQTVTAPNKGNNQQTITAPSNPKLTSKARRVFDLFNIFTPAAAAELSEDELNIQRALNKKSYDDTIKETLSGKIEAGGGITDVIPDLNNPDMLNKIAIDAGLPTQKEGVIGFREDVATPKSTSIIKSIQNFKRSEDPDLKLTAPEIVDFFGTDGQYKGLNVDEVQNIYDMVSLPGQNRFMAAEGGMMSPEGGIMDLETGRQMYFLGKLVKKATRAVKKVAKSPIGKAALLYAGAAGLGSLGAGGGLSSLFKLNTFAPATVKANLGTSFARLMGGKLMADPTGLFAEGQLPGKQNIFQKALGLVKDNPFGAITAASVVAGALTPQQEEEAQQLADNTGFSIEEARNAILQAAKENYAMDVRARGFKADGGIMRAGYQEGSKEPVAKKTMPLLDMGGKEMDLREDGGFVPIGRMEKADDVPARLSKNEFVFTADAVRNAGDGNVDKGAEVMYNMMKNLESGGDVSEESQGLEGARKMFQTSQRLEEVI